MRYGSDIFRGQEGWPSSGSLFVEMSEHCRVVSEVRDGGRGEDHVGIFRDHGRLVVAVADGAGGTGSGAFAANMVIDEADAFARGARESAAMALMAAERAMFNVGGQSTGIILLVSGAVIRGASVGDSECWWLVDDGFVDVTSAQVRKPLLGDGAMPVAFGPFPATGRLLLGTDGLFNYVSSGQILEVAYQSNIDEAARELAGLPRLPNGEWPDDLGLVLVDLDVPDI